MKPSYYELLKDPRWQRKRLEIMEAANFECSNCGDDKSTLNVHHGYYEYGLKPWEYPNESLHCLCITCHKQFEEKKLHLTKLIDHICTTNIDIEEIKGCIYGLQMMQSINSKFIINSFELAWGVAIVFGISVDEVIYHAQLQKDNSISASVFEKDNMGEEAKQTIEYINGTKLYEN